MRIKIFCLIGVCFIVLAASLTAHTGTIKFARYPNIHEDKIVFTFHGDLWVANDDGSHPYRLTDHVAKDIFPRFSPDGKWVAFSSDRMGNNDIWMIPVRGGEARQLTFHTASDNMVNWTPDGKSIVFQTSRKGTFGSPLYTVDLKGSLPIPLPIDTGGAGMFSPDGRKLAFNRLGFRYWRKHYKGNTNTDIWVQDVGTKEIIQLTDLDIKQFRSHTQDAFPMWGTDGKIYFMSERDDIFNIWKISPEGGTPEQVTFHKKDGIQYPSISMDGRTIVYENEFELWKMDIPGGTPQKISISLDFEAKENLVEYIQADSKADGFGPSPDGESLAVDFHGEIFIIPTDSDLGEKSRITASSWRDRSPVYSPDGKYLVYVSDESGEWEIWLHDLEAGAKKQLTKYENMKGGLLWSPDSKRLAWTASNRLFLSEVGDSKAVELGYNESNGFRLGGWSQDGNWITYARSDDDSNYDVFLFNVTEKKEYNVTQNPYREVGMELSPDDRFLVFSSNRDRGVTHLFALPLESVKEDPDDPLVKARRKKDRKKDKSTKDKKTEETTLKLTMEGIDRRALQLTRGENGVGSFFVSKDGKKVYFTSRDNKGQGLFEVGIDGKDKKKVSDGLFRNLTITSDRKTFFYKTGSSVYKMTAGSKSGKKVSFKFVVEVDKKKEWIQIFEESWRVMKYYFYDENMHGYDWDAIKEVYRPFLDYIGDNQDLYDLTNEMIGELNASHTGVSGPTREKAQTYKTRFLGFEMEPGQDYYRISHIYRDGPADKEWIDMKVGDYVLGFDGKTVKSGDNYWRLINHALNDYVTIDVNSQPTSEGVHKVRIKSVDSLRNIKYEEWVQKNRDYVEKLTNGEIAYVHIRSMNQASLKRFENEIDIYHNRKGIVVDIRYNGGGNIDQQLLDILERRPYEYWNNRWSSRSQGRRPRQAIVGPKVMLINKRSGSDSEVTPLGFRDLGLGRIVGTPTYGAVIATGSYSLINGGRIRRPGSLVVSYDPTKPNNYGINLENYGVAPDVWVENTPEDELKGYDRELKAAVDEALRMLKEKKYRFREEV